MLPLDLKTLIWNKDHKWYRILAVTTYKGDDVIVYQEEAQKATIEIMDISDFCREFQATYEIYS